MSTPGEAAIGLVSGHATEVADGTADGGRTVMLGGLTPLPTLTYTPLSGRAIKLFTLSNNGRRQRLERRQHPAGATVQRQRDRPNGIDAAGRSESRTCRQLAGHSCLP